MASDSEVIKEFLISVGIKVDQQTLGKFGGVIGEVGSKVFLLATALTAAAGAIETFVTVIAGKMEDLYWSSMRLHDSVGAIQDYALGIENLGGSAEGAKGSLENLMRLLRTNPGYGGLLASLGINPRQGATGIMEGLRQRFNTMPYFMAARYAGSLGIDEQTLWAMMNAKSQVGGPYGGLYKSLGMDPDKAAKSAHEFMVQLREIGSEFSVIAAAMANDLMPVAKQFLVWISQFLKNAVVPWLKTLTPEKVQEWVSKFDTMLVRIGQIIDGLYNIMTFLGMIPHHKDPAVIKAQQAQAERRKGAVTSTDMTIGSWVGRQAKAATGAIGNFFGGFMKTSAMMDYYMKQGWTREQAAGIVANLKYESGLNAGQVGDSGQAFGLAQWHPDRQANFRKVFGHDIRQSTGDEQQAFVQWELSHTHKRAALALRAAKTAAQASLAMLNIYEAPANPAASARQRAAIAEHLAGITINQKTSIAIHADSGDAKKIGLHVEQAQSRVNGDLVRNLKPALQ